MTDPDEPPIRSPCLRKCQLHPIDKICLGCFRKLEEIADWARFDHATRERIMAELPARRRAWEAGPGRRRRF
jgi:predicted Fe-S protein YdhL (DUF1289 family)